MPWHNTCSLSLTAYLRGWKDFSVSEHVRSALLSSPFTRTNKGMPHTQKTLGCLWQKAQQWQRWQTSLSSCLFAVSANVCLLFPVCMDPQAWPFPPIQCPSPFSSLYFNFSLPLNFFLSITTLFGYFMNLLFQFFSRAYILLWICSIKLPAFAREPVNFSRHGLTTDLSNDIKQKQETEYRIWIPFTKPRAGFSPGNAMSPHVPSVTWTYSRALQAGALSEEALLAEG